MSTKLIKTVLDSAPELKLFTKRTRQLLEFQALLRKALPGPIADQTFVANLASGCLTVSTGSGATAAKLRQFSPRLLLLLRHKEPKLNALKVVVQVSTGHKALPSKRNLLNHTARNALLNLSSRLEISPLKLAVLKLADRATLSSYKQETLKEINSQENQSDDDSNQ